MDDIAYWTSCLVDNDAKIADIRKTLNNQPQLTMNRMDQVLLRELLTNNSVYIKYLARAVEASKTTQKRKLFRRK